MATDFYPFLLVAMAIFVVVQEVLVVVLLLLRRDPMNDPDLPIP